MSQPAIKNVIQPKKTYAIVSTLGFQPMASWAVKESLCHSMKNSLAFRTEILVREKTNDPQ